ncbi:MAG: ATP-binding protein, partial [Candidatus ainarchaeum sp.]|nr:ATP-binding protein [Candidatus ainarchaeum sp.]
MDKINEGVVIALEGSPSTSEFSFVINPKSKDKIKKGQYIQTENEEGIIFGYVNELVRANRYFERAESVAEYEKSGSFKDHFPSDDWEYLIASTKVLGVFKNGKFSRTSLPPYPGSGVLRADEKMLKEFLGFEDNGIFLGKLKHHELEVKIKMHKLFQKHLAILAMSGAGKSHLAAVMLEELMDRKKEQGRIAVVVIDIHGEYAGFSKDREYSNRVKVVEGKNIKIKFRSLSASLLFEWFPELSYVGKSIITGIFSEMKKEEKTERKEYLLDDFIQRLNEHKAKDTIKEPIRRAVYELKNYRLVGKRDNPKVINDLKPGNMLVLDLSDIDNMKKKRMIAAYIGKKLFSLRKKGRIPPFLLLVEEAHNFATEKIDKYSNISKPVIEKIAREGRKFGACLCLISQRPVNLSTTALSQCNTHIILRVTNPNDLKHI